MIAKNKDNFSLIREVGSFSWPPKVISVSKFGVGNNAEKVEIKNNGREITAGTTERVEETETPHKGGDEGSK